MDKTAHNVSGLACVLGLTNSHNSSHQLPRNVTPKEWCPPTFSPFFDLWYSTVASRKKYRLTAAASRKKNTKISEKKFSGFGRKHVARSGEKTFRVGKVPSYFSVLQAVLVKIVLRYFSASQLLANHETTVLTADHRPAH